MQTFLPYPDFILSSQCLDNKRLNKQIIEAQQIFTANHNFEHGIKSGWQNHPAVKMWRGYNKMLLKYREACLFEWRRRVFILMQPLIIVCSWISFHPGLGIKIFILAIKVTLLEKTPDIIGNFSRM